MFNAVFEEDLTVSNALMYRGELTGTQWFNMQIRKYVTKDLELRIRQHNLVGCRNDLSTRAMLMSLANSMLVDHFGNMGHPDVLVRVSIELIDDPILRKFRIGYETKDGTDLFDILVEM